MNLSFLCSQLNPCCSNQHIVMLFSTNQERNENRDLASLTCFPELSIGCTFARAWHRLHVFPRLASVYMISRANAVIARFDQNGFFITMMWVIKKLISNKKLR